MATFGVQVEEKRPEIKTEIKITFGRSPDSSVVQWWLCVDDFPVDSGAAVDDEDAVGSATRSLERWMG